MNIQERSTFRNIREFPLGLLDDLFGDPNAVPELPPDFDGSLAYVMSTLDYRTTECILMRYQNHMTFADIALNFGVTRSRVQQIVARGMRKLRHPSRLRFIKYGVAEVLRRETARAAGVARQRAEENAVKNYILSQARESAEGCKGDKVMYYGMKLSDIDFSVRAYNCLRRAGCYTVGDVLNMTAIGFVRIRNCGVKTREEILTKIERMGFDCSHLKERV